MDTISGSRLLLAWAVDIVVTTVLAVIGWLIIGSPYLTWNIGGRKTFILGMAELMMTFVISVILPHLIVGSHSAKMAIAVTQIIVYVQFAFFLLFGLILFKLGGGNWILQFMAL